MSVCVYLEGGGAEVGRSDEWVHLHYACVYVEGDVPVKAMAVKCASEMTDSINAIFPGGMTDDLRR